MQGATAVGLHAVVRPRQHHVLKCWPEPFNAIGERRKLFELRIDDRDFQEGDSAELREWNPETKDYTQRWIFCKIGYVLREPFKFPGVKPGFCVWSITLPANHQWPIPQWPNSD